jgi:hypothetical protein
MTATTPTTTDHVRTAPTEGLAEPGTPAGRRAPYRLAAALLVIGDVVFIVSGLFHPDHSHANDHPAAFAEYAASRHWTVIHIGQFAGLAFVLGGLLVCMLALDGRDGSPRWLARFGAASAVATLALYGALQAIDGVALKQAVDAWAHAPLAEKAAGFRTAEGIRWLEWGMRSFAQFMLGLSYLIIAGFLGTTGRLPKALSFLAGISGLAYIVDGYVLSTDGFSIPGTVPRLLALVSGVAWTVWLAVSAWRMNICVAAAT